MSFKTSLILIVLIFLIILIYRKFKGLSGTWNSKKEIEEYALIHNNLFEPIKKSKAVVQKKQNFESLGEKKCRTYLEFLFKTPFPKTRPNFLKNPITKSNLELDCFSDKLKLALEYNGKQHYEFCSTFHSNKQDFYNQKYRDEIKKRLCMKNGIDLIIVPYYIPLHNINNYIKKSLKKLKRI